MTNQEYFEILKTQIRRRYIKKYTRQDVNYELGESDYRKLQKKNRIFSRRNTTRC